MSETDDPNRETSTTRNARERTWNPAETGKWISAAIVLLGIWMILQAVGFNFTEGLDVGVAHFWSGLAAGILLIAVGGYNYSRRSDERVGSVAAAAIAVVVGLWLVISPFILGTTAEATAAAQEVTANEWFWSNVIVGLLAIALGAYSGYKARSYRREVRTTA